MASSVSVAERGKQQPSPLLASDTASSYNQTTKEQQHPLSHNRANTATASTINNSSTAARESPVLRQVTNELGSVRLDSPVPRDMGSPVSLDKPFSSQHSLPVQTAQESQSSLLSSPTTTVGSPPLPPSKLVRSSVYYVKRTASGASDRSLHNKSVSVDDVGGRTSQQLSRDQSRSSSNYSLQSKKVPSPSTEQPSPDSLDPPLPIFGTAPQTGPTSTLDQAQKPSQPETSTITSSPTIEIPSRSAAHTAAPDILLNPRTRAANKPPALTLHSSAGATFIKDSASPLSPMNGDNPLGGVRQINLLSNVSRSSSAPSTPNPIASGKHSDALDGKKEHTRIASPLSLAHPVLDNCTYEELKTTLSEKLIQLSQVQSQNAQLWTLVNKQRTMIFDLQKDLDSAFQQNEKYRIQLSKYESTSHIDNLVSRNKSTAEPSTIKPEEEQETINPQKPPAKPVADQTPDTLKSISTPSEALGSTPAARVSSPSPHSAAPQPTAKPSFDFSALQPQQSATSVCAILVPSLTAQKFANLTF